MSSYELSGEYQSSTAKGGIPSSCKTFISSPITGPFKTGCLPNVQIKPLKVLGVRPSEQAHIHRLRRPILKVQISRSVAKALEATRFNLDWIYARNSAIDDPD